MIYKAVKQKAPSCALHLSTFGAIFILLILPVILARGGVCESPYPKLRSFQVLFFFFSKYFFNEKCYRGLNILTKSIRLDQLHAEMFI